MKIHAKGMRWPKAARAGQCTRRPGLTPPTSSIARPRPIEVVYFQCARALLRSQLGNPATWPDRASLPTAGQMLTAASQGSFDGAANDAALPQRQRDTLY